MKKLIILLIIIASWFYIGYNVGSDTSEKEVVSVETSEDGVQINFEDGTGYWYEYQGGK